MAPTRVDSTTSLELTSVVGVTLTSPGVVLRSLANFSTSLSLPVGLGSSTADVPSEVQIDGQNESRQEKGKKKKVGIHSWVAIDISGRTESLEVDKRAIKKRTSIPTRDLRVLGPLFSASAAILPRERAMVVHLEHIQAVITTYEVLILNPTEEDVSPFIAKLQATLCQRSAPMLMSPPASPATSPQPSVSTVPDYLLEAIDLSRMSTERVRDIRVGQRGGGTNDTESLPFEFCVLEMILEAVLLFLEMHTKQLEKDVCPALEALTRSVSTANLELVRSIKSRLTRLTARVQKVREELEQLLDDDDDMRALYLTRLATPIPDSPGGTITSRTTRGMRSMSQGAGGPHSLELNMSEWVGHDVQDLEMLLEAYFMQADGALNKLTTLKEFINDTEDYINAELDQHRNQLIQFKVILGTASTVLALFLCFLGCLSMNVPSFIYDSPTQEQFTNFVWSLVGITGFVFLCLLLYLRWRGFIGV